MAHEGRTREGSLERGDSFSHLGRTHPDGDENSDCYGLGASSVPGSAEHHDPASQQFSESRVLSSLFYRRGNQSTGRRENLQRLQLVSCRADSEARPPSSGLTLH